MQHQVIIVTGAAGFLGSALTVDLSRDNSVVAVDRRDPGRALLAAAPKVEWYPVDISERRALSAVFENTRQRHGRIDFVVHLAAFYHFDLDWHPEYERTNVNGTANVVRTAIEFDVRRLIFTSSMIAMAPPPPGTMLDERTATAHLIPYGKSKAMNEKTIEQASSHLPATVLRLGGVFSDWCELPPLAGLLQLWGPRTPFNRIVVGRGESAIPYLHRTDWVRLVRSCLDRHESMAPYEVFLGSQHGAVSHRDLFLALRRCRSNRTSVSDPIHVSVTVARAGLAMKTLLGRILGRLPYERAWMLDYVDRPWVADTTRTREKLGWDCAQEMQISARLPVILDRFRRHRRQWKRRNRDRANLLYTYAAD